MKPMKKIALFLIVISLSVSCLGILPVFAENIFITNITKTYGDSPFTIHFDLDSDERAEYSSDNNKVIKVSEQGLVTIKGCGRANVIANFFNSSGYVKTSVVSVTVKPVKQKITDLESNERNINVKWTRDKKADGYYIYCASDKKFTKNLQKINVSKNKNTSKSITKVKSGKKYFVKVCSYKISGEEIILGDFSKTKSIKVK